MAGYMHLIQKGGMMMMMWWIWIIPTVILLVFLFRYISFATNGSQARKRAFEILQERYARGEIDEQEYEQKKNTLKRDQHWDEEVK